ncbi:MAG: shikimate dehydrogenase, partial [Dehalococcoidales bacterium]|nr:shikimate dehydrogenase [Dehalococcoidales bacterium]
MIEIKGTTKVCALIGEPVEHSASPEMHNAAFRKLGLDYVYVAFRVKREDLPRAVAGLRALNVKGFNVTIPHKVEVVSLLDKVDPLAEKIGAVNTVVNEDGRLTGYNTDAEGFLKALTAREVTLEGKTVVILGAGGAARAIGYILAERGTRLIILNRHPEKARELATIIGKGTGAGIEAGSLE